MTSRWVLGVVCVVVLLAATGWNLTRSDALADADAAYRRRDYANSLSSALAHLARRPWSRPAALVAARCFSQLDFPDEAEPYYRRAGTLSLEDSHLRAYAIVRANQHERSIEAYRELLARWPDNVIALRRLAAVQLAMRNQAELLDLAARLIKIPAGAAIGYALRAEVYHDDDNHAEAVAAYERVLELDPELRVMPLPRHIFWSEFCGDLAALGRVAEARRYLRQAVAAAPDAFMVMLLGRGSRLEGDIEDARQCYQRAAELDPRDAFPHVYLGQLAVQQGQHAEALDELQTAMHLDPHNFQAAYTINLVLRRLGRTAEAEKYQQLADEMRKRAAAEAARRGPLPKYAL